MRYRHIFKTTFLLKMQITSKSHHRFFPTFSKYASELSSFTSASLTARGRRTRCTKCWSNLTLKCYANTSVKVDTRIEVECRQTISYLKGCSYLSAVLNICLYLKGSYTYKKINNISLKFHYYLLRIPKIVEIGWIFHSKKRKSKT